MVRRQNCTSHMFTGLFSVDAPLCMVLLQGDAVAFVLGSFKGMKKAQLLKLINDKIKQSSAHNGEAQAATHPHHDLEILQRELPIPP